MNVTAKNSMLDAVEAAAEISSNMPLQAPPTDLQHPSTSEVPSYRPKS